MVPRLLAPDFVSRFVTHFVFFVFLVFIFHFCRLGGFHQQFSHPPFIGHLRGEF
jgi:hypothetical protein